MKKRSIFNATVLLLSLMLLVGVAGAQTAEEFYKNNWHSYYGQLLVNQVKWRKVTGLIIKAK